ncbi:hypothetical protein SAMN05421774_11335 [Gemmobacter megaterium]|uniref:Yip1 domain-containing protein n=1 Tax=Gemmobacter megaterium TaxID=1086013 RepID=A0A1N7QJQ9_9RHOB|nr:hypothetical protein [Gemmobacter megaterium]GGE27112.1 hypothetical protein GCM10011345_36440 [Gemmobacter megaterium]SIT23078.1 hypothetical protein SAMN05421774_11335 [Gemmobacter megaterium]
MATKPQSAVLAWLDRHFSVELPFLRFARNVVLLSLAGLAPTLALYIALSPGLWPHLLATDAALPRFVRQIATNGLPVVLVVNAFGLILFAQLRSRRLSPACALAIDLPARIGAFIALHVVIYPASALMFGSFGGDPVQGLRVVGPTLTQSAAFANLSGVYLYATLISALPLHMAMVGGAMQARALSTPTMPLLIALALAIFGLQALLLTGFSALLAGYF